MSASVNQRYDFWRKTVCYFAKSTLENFVCFVFLCETWFVIWCFPKICGAFENKTRVAIEWKNTWKTDQRMTDVKWFVTRFTKQFVFFSELNICKAYKMEPWNFLPVQDLRSIENLFLLTWQLDNSAYWCLWNYCWRA